MYIEGVWGGGGVCLLVGCLTSQQHARGFGGGGGCRGVRTERW